MLLALLIIGAGVDADGGARQRTVGGDARLRKRIVMQDSRGGDGGALHECWRTSVGEVVARIQAQVPCPLAVQGSLAQERVVLTPAEADAAALMESLGVAVAAVWCPSGQGWVLTDIPELAHLAALDRLTLILSSRAGAELSALTPGQLQLLRRFGKLEARDLTPAQRQGFAMLAAEKYLAYPDGRRSIAPEAFRAEGVFLATNGGSAGPHRESGLAEIGVYFPRTDGGSPDSLSSIPFESLRRNDAGRPSPILRPIRIPLPLPEATWKPPKRTQEEDTSYRADGRLDIPWPPVSRVKGQPLWQLLGTAAGLGKIDLVYATALDERTLPQDLKPASVRDLLMAVEERTLGRWRPVGEWYVLQPDPRVEKVAHTEEQDRERRLRQALEQFQSRLSKESRLALDQNGTLSAARLTVPERAALTGAAIVAFVIRDDVAVRATELKDVSIRLKAADSARGLPRRVQYVLPGTGSKPVELPALPWRESTQVE